jgi:hypothetical protein
MTSLLDRAKAKGMDTKYWYIGMDGLFKGYKQVIFKKLINFEKKVNKGNLKEVLSDDEIMKLLKYVGVESLETRKDIDRFNKAMYYIREANAGGFFHDLEFTLIFRKFKKFEVLQIYNGLTIANEHFKDNLSSIVYSPKYPQLATIFTDINNKMFKVVQLFRILYVIRNIIK